MKRQEAAVVHPLRIILLGIVVSASASLAILLLLRRLGLLPGRSNDPTAQLPAQPAVNTAAPAQKPDHFTEDLLVPGLTHTGTEIAQQDIEDGRSPEGV
jgi:hypothetical protein